MTKKPFKHPTASAGAKSKIKVPAAPTLPKGKIKIGFNAAGEREALFLPTKKTVKIRLPSDYTVAIARRPLPTAPTGGSSSGRHKPQYSLLPPDALEEIAKVATFGVQDKYAPRNWEKGMPYSWHLDALHRHIQAFEIGHTTDQESKCHVLAAAAWRCMALLAYELRGQRSALDDRSAKLIELAKEAGLYE